MIYLFGIDTAIVTFGNDFYHQKFTQQKMCPCQKAFRRRHLKCIQLFSSNTRKNIDMYIFEIFFVNLISVYFLFFGKHNDQPNSFWKINKINKKKKELLQNIGTLILIIAAFEVADLTSFLIAHLLSVALIIMI